MVSPTRRMWRAMGAQRRELALAGLVGAIASLCAVALLGTSAWLISTAAQMPPVLTLTVAAVMVRAFALGRAVFRYIERLVGHDAAFRGLSGLRVSVYDRLESLAPVGLGRFARGDLLTRLVGDVDAALDLPLRVVLPWAQATLVSIATVALCVWLQPSAGLLIGVLVVVALTAAPWLVGRLAQRAERRMAPTRAELTGSVVTAFGAVGDLLANGRVVDATASIDSCDDALTSLTKRSAGALGFGGGVTTALQGAAVVGTLILAIPRVADGSLAPVWLAVIGLLPLALFEVTGGLPASALALQRVRGSADRLAAMEDQPDPVRTPMAPRSLPTGFESLQLHDVSASWSRDGLAAIDGITLSVVAGERVWIVGPSGAGKSTLAAVLLGFLEYRGSMRLNGVEVRDADGDALRTRVGLLAQRSHVFDTSIAQNIALGRMPADDPRISEAIEGAQLAPMVDALPRGSDTMVGTFGAAVSGGEAQRIALARLLVEPWPLLVLDEPTEHLDASTARDLSASLRSATADSTSIVITHRIGEIDPGDRVIVLDEGRIVQDGTASELAGSPGWFTDRLRDEREEADMAALIERLPVGRGVPALP